MFSIFQTFTISTCMWRRRLPLMKLNRYVEITGVDWQEWRHQRLRKSWTCSLLKGVSGKAIRMSVCLSLCVRVCVSVCLDHLFVCLSVCLCKVRPSVCPPVLGGSSVCLSLSLIFSLSCLYVCLWEDHLYVCL